MCCPCSLQLVYETGPIGPQCHLHAYSFREIARVGDGSIAVGAIVNTWEGTYRGKKSLHQVFEGSHEKLLGYREGLYPVLHVFIARLLKITSSSQVTG